MRPRNILYRALRSIWSDCRHWLRVSYDHVCIARWTHSYPEDDRSIKPQWPDRAMQTIRTQSIGIRVRFNGTKMIDRLNSKTDRIFYFYLFFFFAPITVSDARARTRSRYSCLTRSQHNATFSIRKNGKRPYDHNLYYTDTIDELIDFDNNIRLCVWITQEHICRRSNAIQR